MITVSGGSARQRQYVESMIEFAWRTLMPRKKNLSVQVKLKDLKGEAYGYCLAETYNDFELEIDKGLRLRRLLETVAHEMVHVKQYARKELMNDHDWLGKTYNPKKVSYWDLPWEIEAHGREVGLFVRWAEENGLGNKKWTQDS